MNNNPNFLTHDEVLQTLLSALTSTTTVLHAAMLELKNCTSNKILPATPYSEAVTYKVVEDLQKTNVRFIAEVKNAYPALFGQKQESDNG